MKMLLTSAGLTNESLRQALLRLLGRPFAECSAVHIPTAAYGLEGGVGFAAAPGGYWAEFGWRSIGQLELTALPNLPEQLWLPELEAAHAILVAGGNTGYLSYWFRESGFAGVLPRLLENAVYVGVSAGSMIMTPALQVDTERLTTTDVFYDEEYDEAAPPGLGADFALGLVDFAVRPHLDSADFGVDLGSETMERAAAKVDRPLYAIDDNSGILVDGDLVEVISEGAWRRFPPGEND